jgi:hypothetical protein
MVGFDKERYALLYGWLVLVDVVLLVKNIIQEKC